MSKKYREEISDTRFEMELLKELRSEKRSEHEPGRWEYALKMLKQKGYKTVEDPEQKCIRFTYKGSEIKVYPYKGWFSGKGVKDGRGINKLLKQI